MNKKSRITNELYTRWGKGLDKLCPLGEYPRPQMRRGDWTCLNGVWQYAIRDGGIEPDSYDGEIVVPFSPESLLSGVKRQLKPGQTLWYKRSVTLEGTADDKRLLLHFGAVDQRCTVYINGIDAGSHSGGYWPFCFDITEFVHSDDNELTVAVTDYSDKGLEAYAKQKLERGGIWYTAQSGIWQTVWVEHVPRRYISHLGITPRYSDSEVEFKLDFAGDAAPGEYCIEIYEDGKLFSKGSFTEPTARLPMEGFRPWSPEAPYLYTVKITYGQDSVESYFGMREFGVVTDEKGNRKFTLNGRPLFQSGLLDQGYWSDGLYTPPSDEAMAWEITELKRLGFNMLRKHIKIEPLRWYYHCDRLGMLVWQDFVSGGGPYRPLVTQYLPFINIRLRDSRHGLFGRKNKDGQRIFERDMERTVRLLGNAACIAVWVPFNEGWGQFDSCRIAKRLKEIDGARLVDHASGWYDQGCGDFCSRHIYYKRFRMRPDRRGRIQALSEFGGYSCPTEEHMTSDTLFGYKMYQCKNELTAAYEELFMREVLPAVKQGLCACVYTQVSDVEDEINGVFTYDRAMTKIDENTVCRINIMLSKAARET